MPVDLTLKELKARLRELGYIPSSVSPVDAKVIGLEIQPVADNTCHLAVWLSTTHLPDKQVKFTYRSKKRRDYRQGVLLYAHNNSFPNYAQLKQLLLAQDWVDLEVNFTPNKTYAAGNQRAGVTRKLREGRAKIEDFRVYP